MHGDVISAKKAAIALFIGILAIPASAAERAEAIDRTSLRVCADPAAPPMSTEDGKGYENAIAELLAKDLGVPVQYTWFPNTFGFFRRTLNVRRCDVVMGVATGIEPAQTTAPYFRSTYALVSRKADGIAAKSLEDESLKPLRIGVQAGTPPTNILAGAGMLGNTRSYDLMVDSRVTSIGRQLVDDLAAKQIDVAVLWGPIAAYFTKGRNDLTVTLLPEKEAGVPLAFDISMALRFGEPAWRARLNRFIHDKHDQIQDILKGYNVPLLPVPETDK